MESVTKREGPPAMPGAFPGPIPTLAQRSQRFVAEVIGALASSLDYDATLAKVTQMAVPELADWCLAFVSDRQGRVRHVESALADSSRAALLDEVQRLCAPFNGQECGVTRVLKTGRAEFYPEPSEELERALGNGSVECKDALRRLGLDSAVLAPLAGHERTVGVLVLAFSGSGRRHGCDDRELAEELGRHAGLAVDHALLHREVQVAEARHRSLFEGAQDPIFIIDEDGAIIEANPAASAALGFGRDELAGMALSDARLALKPDEVQLHLESLRTDKRWRGELDLLRKDGAEVPLEARAAPVESAAGVGYVLIAREISDRRALEKMQRDFIALVTHELRNPLSVVKGYAQLMQRTGATSDRGLSAIIAQVNHMDRLVSDLLEVSRIEAGRLELRRTKTDLAALTRACCDQAQALSRIHSVRLTIPDGPIIGYWDRDRLEEVLQNLLTNAIKYAPEGGEIGVRVEECEGGKVQVSVRDQGIGIPVEALPRLFRRFFRVEGSSSVAKGLGLGLYVSRSLVEAHGGHIWAEPADGKGTVFTFSLPREPPQVAEQRL